MQAMETKAQAIESQVRNAATKEDALQHAIAATEIYMKAVKLASNDSDRTRLRARCMALLAKAEEIKLGKSWPVGIAHDQTAIKQLTAPLSDRALSTREQRILLESSRLHGLKFPQWVKDPDDKLFDCEDGTTLFTEADNLGLSNAQADALDGWKRPNEALRRSLEGTTTEIIRPTMRASAKIDLVQDVTADCSVVASLCAGVARAEEGFVKISSSIIFPYSHDDGCPTISKNGKYIFKFHFNGCFRQVVVDDRLPASKTSRTLFVSDRRNPGLLWPALLEKAYLKVRGGYDFPGSNSGTDLWILTGWLPEQIFLQSDELRPQELWRRVHKSYGYGDVILTLGTGRLSEREEEGLGLAGEHDYAVLSLKEINGQQMLLVKNPWCDGMVWKESGHIPTDTSEQWASELRSALPEVDDTSLGTFWIPFDQVVRNFESMYLNWNPGLFTHRQDHHFSWAVSATTPPSCFSHNPQYSLSSYRGATVWILLSKHFTTEEYHIAKRLADNRSGSSGLGFISIYAFEAGGKKIHVSDDALHRGAFVDSPQTLACLEMPANSNFTIVAAQQDLPLPRYSFTLSVFSRVPVQIAAAEDPYPHQTIMQGLWTTRTAGGNASSPSYASNPQFSINVTSDTDMTFLLETDRPELAIHVKMVWAAGERVSAVTARDIVGESGDYRRGFASTNLRNVAAGKYTIICSTFEAGQIVCESAGRLSHQLPTLIFGIGVYRMLAPVTVNRLTRLRVIAKHVPTAGRVGTPRSRTPLRVAFEQGQGPNKTVLTESSNGDFSDALTGAKTADIDISTEMDRKGRVWLVVERFSGSNEDEVVNVEVLSDVGIQVAAWGLGNG